MADIDSLDNKPQNQPEFIEQDNPIRKSNNAPIQQPMSDSEVVQRSSNLNSNLQGNAVVAPINVAKAQNVDNNGSQMAVISADTDNSMVKMGTMKKKKKVKKKKPANMNYDNEQLPSINGNQQIID